MPAWTRRQVLGTSIAAGGSALAVLGGCGTWTGSRAVPLRAAPELALLAPQAPREFRAVWVATVANIDWPSRKGLSTEQQQTEMRTLLDSAVALRLNAIILQVRTSADALYASELEPWSEYLTGTQGQAPEPYYDPLALWIAEAHARGLELHAWFNPFRARQSKATSVASGKHLSQTQPQWVKSYGDMLWIDPGEPGAADHSIAVFMDVLKRYDVDGIHIDDYFYPYPVTLDKESKSEIDFPDEPAWLRYIDGGGKLSRPDWRRSNVDALIERIYKGIRQTKPWVRFGISPFGLGRPGLRPPGIQGFSQYHKLYANVEYWMQEGWLDYLVPQLYWPIDQKEQAFVPLLEYWHGQNTRGRHVWPGLFTSKVAPDANAPASWVPQEIAEQIARVRERAPGSGHVHFSAVTLVQNRQGIADMLQSTTYRQDALVPSFPWLAAQAISAPAVALQIDKRGWYRIQLKAGADVPMRYAVWARYGGQWLFQAGASVMDIAQRLPDGQALQGLVVSGVDRVGNEGPRVGYLLEGSPLW